MPTAPPRRPHLALAAGLCAAAALACTGPGLRPAPEANETPGRGHGAAASEQGVRVEARVDAWQGTPRELDHRVTPVLVEIENRGDRVLRVRYSEFALIDGSGRRYAALPPFDIEGEVRPVSGYDADGWRGFYVAPHLRARYPLAEVHTGPFTHDPYYYETYYPRLDEADLPTPEMLSRALPEGVLAPGGRASGFVYFERVDEPARGQLDFRFSLVGAQTQRDFGAIEIPFTVESAAAR